MNPNAQVAALYCRISEKDDSVDKTEIQERRLRETAAASGYTVAEVFTDDGISAYSGAERPAFLRLLAGVKAGRFGVVMAVAPDRFARKAADMDTLQVLCANAGTVLHTLTAGISDPGTPMARAMGQIMGVLGELESATKIERQRARNEDETRKGNPLWGIRPFGWETDRKTIRESEARYIREAYAAILAGATLYSVAKAWNTEGLRTTMAGIKRKAKGGGEVRVVDGYWTTNNLKQLLLKPSNAGMLERKGVIVAESLPQIVSTEDYELLKAKLTDPSRAPEKGPKTRHLLTGIMRCSCGGSMRVGKIGSGPKDGKRYVYEVYRCSRNAQATTGHQYIRTTIADDAIAREVFNWLVEHPEAEETLGGPELNGLLLEHAEVRRKVQVTQELALMPGADLQHTGRVLMGLSQETAELERKIEAARAGLAGAGMAEQIRYDWWSGPDYHERFKTNTEDFIAWWHTLDLDRRRETVRSMMKVGLFPKGHPEVEEGEPASRLDVEWLI
jgi:site-specific DNA recombinase